MSLRTQMSIGMTVLFGLGLAGAFMPFQAALRQMQTFCVDLPTGLTSAEVRAQAFSSGYDVSFEDHYTRPPPPERPDGGDVDGGSLDEHTSEPIDAGASKVGTIVTGKAFVADPRSQRPRCLLVFDASGRLTSKVFNDD
jgi:hypothetical protein